MELKSPKEGKFPFSKGTAGNSYGNIPSLSSALGTFVIFVQKGSLKVMTKLFKGMLGSVTLLHTKLDGLSFVYIWALNQIVMSDIVNSKSHPLFI